MSHPFSKTFGFKSCEEKNIGISNIFETFACIYVLLMGNKDDYKLVYGRMVSGTIIYNAYIRRAFK